MQRALRRTFVALSCTASAAFAQTERPAGPPWHDVCAPMEQSSWREVFNSDQCMTDFQKAYDTLEVAPLHDWMVANQSCFHEWAHFTWLAYTRHEPKMAQLAWNHQLYLINDRVLGDATCKDDVCVAGHVEALLTKGLTTDIGAASAAATDAFLDTVEQNTEYKDKMDKASAAVTPICLLHADLGCIGAMRKALGWMYPHGYVLPGPPSEHTTFSMLATYRTVFADSATQHYASDLALRLMHRIASGALAVSADDALYTEGLEAFHGDTDRFWQFMIVYSTRGAAWATSYLMAQPDNQPLFAAMMVVSAAMGYLDTAYAAQDLAWSYVPRMTSSCYQPKPYHYWMTAGFSYLLRKEGYNDRTSRLVARLLGAMYELGSTTMGREPDAVFFVPPFDTIVNRTRREVTHHALGAELGLSPEAPPAQSFDDTYLTVMETSKALPAMTDDAMREKLKDNATKWKYWTDLVGFYFER